MFFRDAATIHQLPSNGRRHLSLSLYLNVPLQRLARILLEQGEEKLFASVMLQMDGFLSSHPMDTFVFVCFGLLAV